MPACRPLPDRPAATYPAQPPTQPTAELPCTLTLVRAQLVQGLKVGGQVAPPHGPPHVAGAAVVGSHHQRAVHRHRQAAHRCIPQTKQAEPASSKSCRQKVLEEQAGRQASRQQARHATCTAAADSSSDRPGSPPAPAPPGPHLCPLPEPARSCRRWRSGPTPECCHAGPLQDRARQVERKRGATRVWGQASGRVVLCALKQPPCRPPSSLPQATAEQRPLVSLMQEGGCPAHPCPAPLIHT